MVLSVPDTESTSGSAYGNRPIKNMSTQPMHTHEQGKQPQSLIGLLASRQLESSPKQENKYLKRNPQTIKGVQSISSSNGSQSR